MDHSELLECVQKVRERQSMYVPRGTFHKWVAFFTGLDLGVDGLLLEKFGFSRWIVRNYGGERPELGWPGLAGEVANGKTGVMSMSDDEEARATFALFDLLIEFLVEQVELNQPPDESDE